MAKNGNVHPSRIFKTTKELLKVWNGYKEDLKERAKQWEKIQYVGREGEKRTDYPKMPLTFDGLKRYCWDCSIGNIEQYFTNQDNCYDDFIGVCRAIKNEIREDQITGGLLNVYNTSITQRLNSLSEKSETTIREQPLFKEE
jgi:hypothetical protein